MKDAFVANGTFERKFKFACEIDSQNSLSVDEQNISPPPQNQTASVKTVNVDKLCKSNVEKKLKLLVGLTHSRKHRTRPSSEQDTGYVY